LKKIIDNKIYDTEKATKIYEYSHKWFEECNWLKKGWGFTHWENAEVYKTNKDNCFIYFYDEGYPDRERIEIKTLDEIKELVKKLNPDEFIKLFGDSELEEA